MVELELREVGGVDGGLEGMDEDEEEGEFTVPEYESSARPCFASVFVSSPEAHGRSAPRMVLSASGSFLG
jgi:hypothetical protein